MRRLSISKLHSRWLLLLIYVIGYLLTMDAYPSEWMFYLLLNIISFLSAWVVLSRLRKIGVENAIIWIIFIIILVGYYLKHYFIVRGVLMGKNETDALIVGGHYAVHVATSQMLLNCFTTIVLSFSLFAITSYYLLRGRRKCVDLKLTFRRINHWSSYCYTILFVSTCMAMISGYLRWVYKLGIPGEATGLPFKLAGLITVTSTYIVSTLFGLALIYAVQSYKRQPVRVTIIIFFTWGIIQYLLFGSKLFLVFPMLWIFFIGLWLKKPLLRPRYFIWYAGLFIFMYPFLNLIRSFRREGINEHIFENFYGAVQAGTGIGDYTGLLSYFIIGIYGLISRVVGLDSLLMLVAIRPEIGNVNILSGLWGGAHSVEAVLTEHLLGAGNAGTGIAQSLIGQAYFLTGNSIMTAVLVAAWTVFTHQVAKVLYKMNSSFSQVIWVTWIVSVLQWTSDGITIIKLLFFLVAAIPVFFITKMFEIKKNYFSLGARIS